MRVYGFERGTSWQDLKDFARGGSQDVTFTDVTKDSSGRVGALFSFLIFQIMGVVEYRTQGSLDDAIAKLDKSDLKGSTVRVYKVCPYRLL